MQEMTFTQKLHTITSQFGLEYAGPQWVGVKYKSDDGDNKKGTQTKQQRFPAEEMVAKVTVEGVRDYYNLQGNEMIESISASIQEKRAKLEELDAILEEKQGVVGEFKQQIAEADLAKRKEKSPTIKVNLEAKIKEIETVKEKAEHIVYATMEAIKTIEGNINALLPTIANWEGSNFYGKATHLIENSVWDTPTAKVDLIMGLNLLQWRSMYGSDKKINKNCDDVRENGLGTWLHLKSRAKLNRNKIVYTPVMDRILAIWG